MTPPKLIPLPARLDDIFPDWGEEVDRRIAASETRIKFWILGGVLGNLIVVLIPAIMMIFYFGQVSSNLAITSQQMKALSESVSLQNDKLQDLALWRAASDARATESERKAREQR